MAIGDGAISDVEAQRASDSRPFVGTSFYHCNACSSKLRLQKEREDEELAHCYKCGSQDVKYIGRPMSGITSTTSRTMIRALDAVAEGTMKTYGMTDLNLNSNNREGDNCAPKLAPRLQTQVDSFFNHSQSPYAAQMQRAGSAALAGAHRDPGNPVAQLHNQRVKPMTERPMPKLDVSVKQQDNIKSYDKMITTR